MSTAYSRRAGRITASPPHSQTWRECANDAHALTESREHVETMRGLLVGVSLSLAVWLTLAGLLWWSLEILAVAP